MASPLRWFRKYSFFFIVIFGVLLMGIFGLGSVVTGLNPSSFSQSAQAENKTVAQWSGGELKEFDLAGLRQRHFASLRFLRNIHKYAIEQNGGNEFPIAVEQILPIIRPGENPSIEEMDARIMNRYLFAQRAQKEGFIVDENMVLEYIAQYGGDTLLNKNIFKQLNRQVNQQVPLTAVVRHLQTELLWQQMETMTRGGLPFDQTPLAITAIAPTEALQLYARTAKKLECVVLPIPLDVDSITDEPSSSEISELYEQGKYEYPTYNFDTPGFKVLKKAKVQYFMGEMKTFLDNEIAKLTDEEIQAEYDRLVEAEDRSVMQVMPVEEKKPAEGQGTTDAADQEDPAPAPAAGEAPMEGGAPAEGAIEEVVIPDGGTTVEGTPVEGTPVEGTPGLNEVVPETVPETVEPVEEGSGGYTSLKIQDQPTEAPAVETIIQETVNNQETGTIIPQEPAPGIDPTKEIPNAEGTIIPQEPAPGIDPTKEIPNAEGTVIPQEPAPGIDPTKEIPNAEGTVIPQESAPGSVPMKETPSVESTQETAEPQSQSSEDDPVIADEPETKMVAKPLSEVVETIKRKMKIQDARIARDKALETAEKEITFYQRDLSTYERDLASGKDDAVEPPTPDFNEIADRLGIQFVETEAIDETQIADEEIGKVVDISIGPGGQAQQINVGEQIFANFESLPEYQVMIANDFMKNAKFLYWLADKSEQSVPTLDEARESIINYWKRNKAVEIAIQEAEKIANDLNQDSDKLLNELYPEKAKLTGQFTWFSSFGRFAYGAPEGVKSPGEEFMGVAFDLQPRKAGFALNELRDEAYVIQSVQPEDAQTDLAADYIEKQFFMTKQLPREVVSAKVLYRRRMNQDWLRQFRKSMDVKIVGQ